MKTAVIMKRELFGRPVSQNRDNDKAVNIAILKAVEGCR